MHRPAGLILEGLVGSHAYGLATENSDRDIKGVFVAPTDEVLSLKKPRDVFDGKTEAGDDYSYYEVEKFLGLALKCNPTILEMLYLNNYLHTDRLGMALVFLRPSFLSTNAVRNAFGGYAYSQVKRLLKREEEGKDGFGKGLRYAKHARHCFRLLEESRQLLATGTMSVIVPNREELFAVGELEPEALMSLFVERTEQLDSIKSVLPDEPDYEAVNRYLLWVRKEGLCDRQSSTQ